MNQFVKQAYVQGLAARAILRARIMQKQAGGVKDYALAGGVGAGGGALIGALINYARKKNMLSGALAGAGIGGVAGLGYQGIKDWMGSTKEDPGHKWERIQGKKDPRPDVERVQMEHPELALYIAEATAKGIPLDKALPLAQAQYDAKMSTTNTVPPADTSGRYYMGDIPYYNDQGQAPYEAPSTESYANEDIENSKLNQWLGDAQFNVDSATK